MGISAAMTTKERKQILAGLLDQGAVEVRDGSHGTILNLPDGGRFIVPSGTSDYKARLAMRAEIRRHGLHWPLDPPPQEKEKNTSTATVERPLLEHKAIPTSVQTYGLDWRPAEPVYRRVEAIFRDFAGKTPFWTDAVLDEIRAQKITGYAASSAMQRVQLLLHFAGFRTIEAKTNRSGRSYRWSRDERQPWPELFAPEVKGAAAVKMLQAAGPQAVTCSDCGRSFMIDRIEEHQRHAKHGPFAVNSADHVEESAFVPTPPTPLDLDKHRAKKHVILTTEEAARELGLPAAEEVEGAITDAVAAVVDDDNAALGLAVEQEQRAIRAERELARVQEAVRAERQARDNDRRAALRRQADLEGQLLALGRLVTKAESERDEARAMAEERLTMVGQAVGAVAPPPADDGGWWPLEGGTGTVADLLASAQAFGLEVRVQARRVTK